MKLFAMISLVGSLIGFSLTGYCLFLLRGDSSMGAGFMFFWSLVLGAGSLILFVGSGLFLTGIVFGATLFKLSILVFGCVIAFLMFTVH